MPNKRSCSCGHCDNWNNCNNCDNWNNGNNNWNNCHNNNNCCNPHYSKKKGITNQQKKRVVKSINKRKELLDDFKQKRIPYFNQNCDEMLPHFWGSFNKALPNNDKGLPDPNEYRKLLCAIESGDQCDFERIMLGGQRKLANPMASYAFDVIGCDSWDYSMLAAPSATSAETAAEMLEVYAKALLRDIPLDMYDTLSMDMNMDMNMDNKVFKVITELNKLKCLTAPKENGMVTGKTLFRGNAVGDLKGPYVSQFLLLPITNGAITYDQRYCRGQGDPCLDPVGNPDKKAGDFLTNRGELLDVLNGSGGYKPEKTNVFKYIETGRDLAEYVHWDYPCQTFINAALILYSLGAPLNSGNPYGRTIHSSGSFVTMGISDITSLIGTTCRLALKSAWVQKWVVNRRIRPEAFGLRVHDNIQMGTNYSIDSQMFNSGMGILNMIKEYNSNLLNPNNTYLLPMAYSEGSPTHPSYPAGHAVVSGACATVLKAFFDGDYQLVNKQAKKSDGSLVNIPVHVVNDDIVNYIGDTLTVEGELNKLASNIAIGRNIAGVHYRSDGDQGMLLGEQVAVSMLRDYFKLYAEEFCSWSFNGFRGNRIYIFRDHCCH
jgi:membrane-associated phospholipid phosphatase